MLLPRVGEQATLTVPLVLPSVLRLVTEQAMTTGCQHLKFYPGQQLHSFSPASHETSSPSWFCLLLSRDVSIHHYAIRHGRQPPATSCMDHCLPAQAWQCISDQMKSAREGRRSHTRPSLQASPCSNFAIDNAGRPIRAGSGLHYMHTNSPQPR